TLGMVMVALGGAWVCLWQQRWRWWGSVAVVAGMATMLLTRPPDVILGDFGRFLAARTGVDDYVVAETSERLTRSFLVSYTHATLLPWPAGGSAAAGPLDCAGAGRCPYASHGHRVRRVPGGA